MLRLHAHAFLLLVAAVMLGASGCGGDAAPPQALPPLPSSTTPSATPSPTAAATATDLRRSAEKFVRDYARELDRANRTSDSSVLERAYYLPSCRSCRYDIDMLKKARRSGRHIEGYATILESVEAHDLAGNTIRVTVVLRGNSGRVVDRSGHTVQELPATAPLKNDVIVARTDRSWRIAEIVPLGEVK